jgi:hypothetical protein
MICYVSKYRFVTKIELDFLVYLENNGFEYVSTFLIESKLRTNLFLITVSFLKKIEGKLQLLFKPSRYFQDFEMYPLQNCSAINSNNLNSNEYLYISASGLKVIRNTEVARFRKEVLSILRLVGIEKPSVDQSQCKIEIYNGKMLIEQYLLNYERDNLPLNNNIIVLRNLFEHIKQIF